PRPNIVFITADDLGYGDLSGYGRADYTTPVLDRLAAEGTRFTQAYSIAPVCTPARVGFMTGRYPARHPVGLREPLTLTAEDRALGLEPTHPTVSSLLKEAGYTNALFGKWHLGTKPEFHPNRHGFTEFFGPLGGAVDYVSHHGPSGAPDLYRNGDAVAVEGYLTDLLSDEAVRFIREKREPFFLSHQGTSPHSPWQRRGDPPVERSVGPFNVGPADRFPDMVRALDEAVGRLLATLAETGLASRTLVIFTSDNGGVQYSNMGGLARQKMELWEGGIRVPAFARWPGVIPAGVTTLQVASTLDWSATILAAAGAPASPQHRLDGIDLLPVLAGREPSRERTIFWRTSQRTHQGAVRQGGWKYLRDEEGEYLFDLILDPGERHNRKSDQPATFERLRALYAAWDREMLPPVRLSPVAREVREPV
ncbi:MAG TPA: sulfatase-like hydrolase/transferase, partial [Hyphomicrobiaceae bacterium]|nr:sulfatase-like hydrolase/transferase [Hyphomicrobiaceae bacterium]